MEFMTHIGAYTGSYSLLLAAQKICKMPQGRMAAGVVAVYTGVPHRVFHGSVDELG
jgi:hypothetical protein